MSQETMMGWEVMLTLRGRELNGPAEQPAQDVGAVRLFVMAPDLTRAEEAALGHVKEHVHAGAAIAVTEARIARITRIEDCCVIWRASLH